MKVPSESPQRSEMLAVLFPTHKEASYPWIHCKTRAEPWQPSVLLHRTACFILYSKKCLMRGHPLLLQQEHFPLPGWKGVNFLHSEPNLIISKFISVWLTFLDFFSESLNGWRDCAYGFRSCYQWLKQHPADESVIHQISIYTFFFRFS